MTQRGRTLDKARALVTRNRARQHGDFAETYGGVAEFWRAWLKARYGVDLEIGAYDCAMMLGLMKFGRAGKRPRNLDNYVDAAGYVALGSELAARRRRR